MQYAEMHRIGPGAVLRRGYFLIVILQLSLKLNINIIQEE